MPIYEYRCPKCGRDFEKLVRMDTEPKDVECPHCNHKGADKKLSLFGTKGGDSLGRDSWGNFSPAPAASCGTGSST